MWGNIAKRCDEATLSSFDGGKRVIAYLCVSVLLSALISSTSDLVGVLPGAVVTTAMILKLFG